MEGMRFPLFLGGAEQAPSAAESIKRENTSKGSLLSPLSNKGGPSGKGTQTGGNPRPPVHRGEHPSSAVSLTNLSSPDSWTESDRSGETMPEPAPVMVQTSGGSMPNYDKARCSSSATH